MTPASLLALLHTYRYWVLFPLAFFEGPIIALIAGLFVSQGYLEAFPTYIILSLGDIVPDTLYYWIGRLSHQANFLARYGHRFGISKDRLHAIEQLWQRHTFKSVLFSKWAYGMSTPLLLSAGLARVPAKKYISYIVPIVLMQYAVLLVIGYYFGSSYQLISMYVKDAGWVIAAGVVIFLVIYFIVARSAKRKLLRETESQ